MYGAFHLLGLMQTGRPIDKLDVAQRPKLQLRMVDHWDNLNGSIERGYAGRSLWQWSELPDKLSPRYADYARAIRAEAGDLPLAGFFAMGELGPVGGQNFIHGRLHNSVAALVSGEAEGAAQVVPERAADHQADPGAAPDDPDARRPSLEHELAEDAEQDLRRASARRPA
jgi:hypothetical protein